MDSDFLSRIEAHVQNSRLHEIVEAAKARGDGENAQTAGRVACILLQMAHVRQSAPPLKAAMLNQAATMLLSLFWDIKGEEWFENYLKPITSALHADTDEAIEKFRPR